MPEVRIDPLSGHRTIVASDRAARPGGGLSATAPDPIDTEKDPFLEGHEDRTPPETYALRANGGAPDTPGWRVRVVPNLYPALDPGSALPEPFAKPDLFAVAPARGAHEVVDQRARSGHLAGAPRRRAGRRGARRVAPAHAHAHRERRGLRARHRQRAPRGRRVAAAHARADLRAGLRPRRRGARARALRRLRAADDGRPTCCRTSSRRRSSCASASSPSTTRRSSWRPTARSCPSSSCSRRACRGRASRTTGRRAPRCCTTACNRLGRKLGNVPPLNLWVRTAPARRRPLLLAHRRRAAPDAHGRPRARRRRAPEHRRARAGGGRAARGVNEGPALARARAARHPRGRARRRRDGRRDRRPGCSCCSASPTTTTRPSRDRLADKVRALRIFADADGRMNDAAGRARGARRQPVHPVRRRAQGQPPLLRRRGAAPSTPSRSTSASPIASAPPAASSAR